MYLPFFSSYFKSVSWSRVIAVEYGFNFFCSNRVPEELLKTLTRKPKFIYIPAVEAQPLSMLTTYWHVHRISSCPLNLKITSLSGWALKWSAWGADNITGLTEYRAKGTKASWVHLFACHISESGREVGAREFCSSCGSVLHSYGQRHARTEMGDTCSVSVPQMDMYQSASRTVFWNTYSKHLHKALGRIELNQIYILRQHTSHQLVLCFSLN